MDPTYRLGIAITAPMIPILQSRRHEPPRQSTLEAISVRCDQSCLLRRIRHEPDRCGSLVGRYVKAIREDPIECLQTRDCHLLAVTLCVAGQDDFAIGKGS